MHCLLEEPAFLVMWLVVWSLNDPADGDRRAWAFAEGSFDLTAGVHSVQLMGV